MKIEICEGDGYLYEGGIHKNFILIVDGKRIIYPADRTVAELVGTMEKWGGAPVPQKETVVPQEETQRQVDPSKIEMFDEVEFIGPEDKTQLDADNTDLVLNRHYTIQAVTKTQYHLVDWNSPVPIRLAVPRNWVKLVKKHDPALLNKKTVVFDITYTCDCGKIIALTMPNIEEPFYVGKCDCGKDYAIPRADIDKVKSARETGDGVLNNDINAHNPKIVLKLK